MLLLFSRFLSQPGVSPAVGSFPSPILSLLFSHIQLRFLLTWNPPSRLTRHHMLLLFLSLQEKITVLPRKNNIIILLFFEPTRENNRTSRKSNTTNNLQVELQVQVEVTILREKQREKVTLS